MYMRRIDFIRSLALLPLAATAGRFRHMTLPDLSRTTSAFQNTPPMPVLFVGHGNPMNAITGNTYSEGWQAMASKLPRPSAVLCISAHWLTRGTAVAVAPKPVTIHDFGGFPDELFKVNYPAKGAPEFADLTVKSVTTTPIMKDHEWGLDHGAWSVLMNMYPNADIPVYQLSIDYDKPPRFHFNLARELTLLRKKGVLIVASGNIVHNLGKVSWDSTPGNYDWAIEFDQVVKTCIENRDDETLIGYDRLGKIASMAHPTNDHYLPLMYAIGLRSANDQFRFFNDSFDMGSVSMRSVVFG
jgi:4,5-DOPA dioxygenase extradiol